MRFRNEGFKTSGKDNRYGILQKNLKLNLEETAMKSLFEQMGGTYTLQGDYYLPNVTLPAEGNKTIGIWGQRHLRGTAAFAVYPAAQKSVLHQSAHKRQAERLSCGY